MFKLCMWLIDYKMPENQYELYNTYICWYLIKLHNNIYPTLILYICFFFSYVHSFNHLVSITNQINDKCNYLYKYVHTPYREYSSGATKDYDAIR